MLVDGWCQLTASDNVAHPGTQPVSGGGEGSKKCTSEYVTDVEFDCTRAGYHWYPTYSCWTKPLDEQPSYDDPVWEGRTDGVIVNCVIYECLSEAGVIGGQNGASCEVGEVRNPIWVASWEGVSPYLLALQAVSDMGLRAPQIGMTGGSPPEGMQIVGIPAWMWAADPGESTTGPVTRSATAGSVTVTATGRLDRTVWAMGDGVTVTCEGAGAGGTPYEARYDKQPSPTCGYTYTRTSAEQPGEVFNVTVTAYWTITWSGGDGAGTIAQERTRTTQKQVGELQALVVGPGDRR